MMNENDHFNGNLSLTKPKKVQKINYTIREK